MPEGYDISDLSEQFLRDLAMLQSMSSRISSYSVYLYDMKDDRYPLVNWLALSLQAIKKELSYQTDGTWLNYNAVMKAREAWCEKCLNKEEEEP